MLEADLVALLTETFWVALKLSGPPLLAAMVAGLVMSLIQAVTQMNEPTLSFVPKAAAVVATLAVAGPFMWSGLDDFTHALLDRLVTVGGG
jgi:flagellar biosynthetic protein FliQ